MLAQPYTGAGKSMTASDEIVFLLDVENTLFDHDYIGEADLKNHLERELGFESRARHRVTFEALRAELGYANYLGALHRYRQEDVHDPQLLRMSSFLGDYLFAKRLYPGAIEVVKQFRAYGTTVILDVAPLGDAGVHYWGPIIERYGLNLTVVNKAVDPTFWVMTVNWDGQTHMDPFSPLCHAAVDRPKGWLQSRLRLRPGP